MANTKTLLTTIATLQIIVMAGCTDKGIIPAEKIILDKTALTLAVGDTCALSATVLPENTTDSLLSFESSMPDIASISDKGLITALSEGRTTIKVSASAVSEECIVTVFKPEPPEIGDFYYSDGTWSTELDTEKTTIGIIFWCGDPAKDDPLLRREHPDCTNGLVVAINGEQESGWQSYYLLYGKSIQSWIETYYPEYQTILAETGTETGQEGLLNKMTGYNNTKAIEKFNSAPENEPWKVDAVEKAVQYRETVPAPETSSGWYLPSAKELTLLAYGETDENIYFHDQQAGITDLVNERLSQVDEGQPLASHDFIWTYWASNEYDEQEAYNVSLMSGATFHYKKGAINYFARFILAF